MHRWIADRLLRRCNRSSVRHWTLFTVGVVLGYFFAVCLHITPHLFFCTMNRQPFSLGGHRSLSDQQNSDHRQLLLVAVLTSDKYLHSRASAINQTWGRKLRGRLLFFVGENCSATLSNVAIVRLAGVDDFAYPPQRKSMEMLRYVHENYGSKFEWFLRADDDLFVRVDRLQELLRSLDADQPLIIGQAGFGRREEYGNLGLDEGQPYCMGGTGILLSRTALAKTAPNVQQCLQDVRSNHEDVELNRCVQRFTGVTCTWSVETKTLFYNNYSGSEAFTGDLNVPEVHHAVSLHPVKRAEGMRSMFRFFQRQSIGRLHDRMVRLLRKVDRKRSFSKDASLLKHSSPTYGNESKWQMETVWQYFQGSFAYCTGAWECPLHRTKSHQEYAIMDMARQVVDTMNEQSQQRNRVLELKKVLYSYRRVQPNIGVDHVLDLLLLYKRLGGKKMTTLVRRHAYVRQSFLPLRAADAVDNGQPSADVEQLESTLVYIVLPLHGRLKSFQRFIDQLEKNYFVHGENVCVIVVLFPSQDDDDDDGSHCDHEVAQTVRRLNTTYGSANSTAAHLLVLEKQPFNRALGLSKGAQLCPADALMFFADVDMLFDRSLMHRVRLNTIYKKQVFFPVVFSEYKSIDGGAEHLNRSHAAGHFRYFGYGLVSLYRHDFDAVGGMNTGIRGWGLEDVDLFEKFHNQRNMTILRAPEPNLVHAYHEVACDAGLSPVQYRMCNGRKADGYMSRHRLADVVMELLAKPAPAT